LRLLSHTDSTIDSHSSIYNVMRIFSSHYYTIRFFFPKGKQNKTKETCLREFRVCCSALLIDDTKTKVSQQCMPKNFSVVYIRDSLSLYTLTEKLVLFPKFFYNYPTGKQNYLYVRSSSSKQQTISHCCCARGE
jgi:hypothetical protein